MYSACTLKLCLLTSSAFLVWVLHRRCFCMSVNRLSGVLKREFLSCIFHASLDGWTGPDIRIDGLLCSLAYVLWTLSFVFVPKAVRMPACYPPSIGTLKRGGGVPSVRVAVLYTYIAYIYIYISWASIASSVYCPIEFSIVLISFELIPYSECVVFFVQGAEAQLSALTHATVGACTPYLPQGGGVHTRRGYTPHPKTVCLVQKKKIRAQPNKEQSRGLGTQPK